MRNNFVLIRYILLVCFLIVNIIPIHASNCENDSIVLSSESSTLCVSSDAHKLKWPEVAVPLTLVGVSAFCVENGWLKDQCIKVQDAISAKSHKTKVDDYLQYSPMVVAYGLGFCGVKTQHSLLNRTILLAMSYATMGIVVNTMKYTIKEKRPDCNARNSFPSGHTATAFMGAQYLYEEYKDVSPWIGYAGYAVAATTAYLRIYNNRHYLNDVVAGACLGVLSTKFAYWLYPKIFKKSKCGNDLNLVVAPYYSEQGSLGVSLAHAF